MKDFHRVSRYLLGLALAAAFQFANASQSEIRMIVLTDNAEKSSPAMQETDRAGRPGQRDAIRRKLLEEMEKQRLEMAANGFVVETDATISAKTRLSEELVKHQAITGNTYAYVLPDIAYSARDLGASPFKKGRLLGFMPVRSEDNKIHEIVWAYAVPGIGDVIVEELSYRTIPGVTIKVAEPSGNIQINGNPGTYMVMTDEKGKRGLTTIDFITSDKLFTLTAYNPIMRGTKRFNRLVELAESLY